MHVFFVLSCFFQKPEKSREKIEAKTFLGENIGTNLKVLVLDVKVMVPGCGSTGSQTWKYWSLDVSNCVRKCCRKVSDIFEKNESLRLIVQTKLYLVRSYEFLVESLFK